MIGVNAAIADLIFHAAGTRLRTSPIRAAGVGPPSIQPFAESVSVGAITTGR
jgi:hypothetical protein